MDLVQIANNNLLLIFPEGTGVNNNYYKVMFKKVCESFAILVICNYVYHMYETAF
jgi:hypothetical protein